MEDSSPESVARQVQRRVFPRANRLVAANYTDSYGRPQTCVALDFGVRGACLLLESPFPATDELEVSFELEKNWVVPCRVKKVWEREELANYLVGVTYKTVLSTDKNLIGPWVHKMKKQSSS